MYVMKTKPIPRQALWGGTRLNDYFGYQFEKGTAQVWQFAVQKDGANEIVNGEFAGKTLDDIWNEHPEYFESRYDHFPFIIGLVGPEDGLSVQVHPDLAYAKLNQLPSGKNEAWYFIDCDEDADLIFGHNAKDLEDLKAYCAANNYEGLVRRIKVQNNDFVYVPAGVLHAMQKGVVVYEVQEATDVTYRLYDYDRIDKDGKKRKLNIQECYDCIHYNQEEMIPQHDVKVKEENGCIRTCYIHNDSFKIEKVEVKEKILYLVETYLLMTVVKGHCSVEGVSLTIGESALVPKGMHSVHICGNADIMITSEGDNQR